MDGLCSMIRRFFNPSAKSEQSDANVIRYTTTDESLIVFSTVPDCGALMKSHEYGVIRFATPPSRIPADFVYSSPSKSKIKSIILPDSIDEVESSAFSGCTALESIEFGDYHHDAYTMEISLGSYILQGCTNLKKIIFHDPDQPSCAFDSFSGIGASGISVYYPTENEVYEWDVISKLDTPATADVNNFFPVTLVSGTTTVIGKELYERCVSSGENNIDLPGTVTVDGNNVAYVEYYPDIGTDVYFIAGIQQYVLMEDGTLEIGM